MTSLSRPPISVWRPLSLGRFLRGAAHYPEQVDPSFLQRDAERLREVGASCVRMGEFAWHLWEPEEGRFAFDLFDRAIEVMGAHGIDTILCTPTATPPRWLTLAYPEVLRVDAQGRPAQHGSRQHADTTSPVYRAHSRRITQALAEHYRGNPHVIGWQTDNELNNTVSESYSPSCRAAFQTWLAARYGQDIDELNRAWGGNFWALAYDSYDQIDLPRAFAPTYPAPGHVLDYHRFLAAATAAFQADQIAILRAVNPQWFIFHDVGGTSDLDFRGPFGRDVDFLGFNSYPTLYDEFERHGGLGISQAWRMDQARAATGNFIVPEQVCGMGAQPGFASLNPEPGEMRRMAWSSVARGADGLMFFRWRPAHAGAEIYWTGLIDHDDTPNRRFAEARQVFAEFATLEKTLLGTHVRMDLGIAWADFDAQEAHKSHPMNLPSPEDDALHLYRASRNRTVACGLIHPEDDLSPLNALYVPHWVIWQPDWTAAVTRFVEGGGTLVVSALTATRDTHNRVIPDPAPGAGLADLMGVKVREFGRIAAVGATGLMPPMGPAFPGAFREEKPPRSAALERPWALMTPSGILDAAHLYEEVLPESGTETLASWADGWLEGSPAITLRRVGKGKAIYVGTYLTPELADWLMDVLADEANLSPLLADVPTGVEVSVRQADDREIWFFQNATREEHSIPDTPAGHDPVLGRPWPGGTMKLGPHGSAQVVRRRAK